jgi:hypothetical protein
MARRGRNRVARNRAEKNARSRPYMLIFRGPDDRLHTEQFEDAAAYRARLGARRSHEGSVSIDDLCDLLDV